MAGLGDIFGGMNLGGAMSTTGLVFQWILIGLCIGGAGWLMWYYLSFNIKVGINERNGSEGYITKWDKGKFKKNKKNGMLYFVLLRDKRWNQPLDRKYLSMERKSFGRVGKVVMFAEDDESRFQPIMPVVKDNIHLWAGWDNDDMEFVSSQARAVIEMAKKEDFMSKYGALVQIAAFALLVILMIVFLRQMSGVSEGLAGVASAFEKASQQFAGVMMTNGTQVITSG
jgi:hypothetical protein